MPSLPDGRSGRRNKSLHEQLQSKLIGKGRFEEKMQKLCRFCAKFMPFKQIVHRFYPFFLHFFCNLCKFYEGSCNFLHKICIKKFCIYENCAQCTQILCHLCRFYVIKCNLCSVYAHCTLCSIFEEFMQILRKIYAIYAEFTQCMQSICQCRIDVKLMTFMHF